MLKNIFFLHIFTQKYSFKTPIIISRPVLSLGTLSYLTYEGVRFFEELELACRERTVDLKPHLRRMHLVTTAIHEFILTLCTYLDFTHFSQADADKLRKLQAAVSSTVVCQRRYASTFLL